MFAEDGAIEDARGDEYRGRDALRAAHEYDRECEARVKDDSSATIRCLPLDEHPTRSDACVCCGRRAVTRAAWAQAY